MKKLKMETKPQSERALEKIARLFPAIVQNGKIDFEKLRTELTGEIANESDESYEPERRFCGIFPLAQILKEIAS